jgi:hypothetical protein
MTTISSFINFEHSRPKACIGTAGIDQMPIIRDWAVYTGGQQGEAPLETGRILRSTLGQMYQQALNTTGGNQELAEQKLAQSIDNDRRFDAYPTERVVQRFRENYQTGGFLDFDDPYLKGQHNPWAKTESGSPRTRRR